MQSEVVTEPAAGIDTTKTKTFASCKCDRYVVNGQKVLTACLLHSDHMISSFVETNMLGMPRSF